MSGEGPKTGRIELYTWRDFTKVMTLLDAGRWIYRGQEDANWKLESGIDRYLRNYGEVGMRRNGKEVRDGNFLLNFPRAEFFAISRFQAMSQDFEKWESNVAALIAMQHYGAKTRLVDFTTSIMVALFFAYENRVTGKERAIYAINYSSLLLQNGLWSEYQKYLEEINAMINLGDEQARWNVESQIENHYFQQFALSKAEENIKNTQLQENGIIPLYTASCNKRQRAQTGIELMPCTFDWFDRNLARALNQKDVREVNDPSSLVVEDISEIEDPKTLLAYPLIKLVFDPRMEADAWQLLDQANINAATIYPDIVGVARSVHYSERTLGIYKDFGVVKELMTAHDVCVRRKDVVACSLGDTISSVIDVMLDKVYSNVPVLDKEERVVGVFSESTLLDVYKMKTRQVNSLRMKGIAKFLLIEKHIADKFLFVAKDTPIARLRQIFDVATERYERIGMLFVTENGCQREPLLGIITEWDIAIALDPSRRDNMHEAKHERMA